MATWRDRLAIALPIVCAVLLIELRFGAPVFPMDEGMPVVYGDLIRRGLLPYRDYQSFYGPGMPALIGAADAVLGTSLRTERVVAALAQLAIVLGAVVFARRWGTGVALAAGLVAATELGPTFAWAALGAAACGLWSLIAVARVRGVSGAVLSGLLAGVAITFRPDYVVIAVVPALIVLWKRAAGVRAAYLAALSVALVPLGAFIMVVTPAAALSNLITDSSVAVRQRLLPIPLDRASDLSMLAFIIVSAIWAAWHGFRSARRGSSLETEHSVQLAAYGALTLLVIPQVVERFDPIHYSILIAIGVVPCVILTATLLGQLRRGGRLNGVAFAARTVFFAIIVAGVGIGIATPPTRATLVARGDRSYPEDPIHARQINAIVAATESYVRPGMRLFIGQVDLTHAVYNDTILYFLYPDLVPATYYLEMEPGTANRPGSRLADDIASADLLILTTRWDHWREPNGSSLPGSDAPTKVVETVFRLVAREGDYALYVRR